MFGCCDPHLPQVDPDNLTVNAVLIAMASVVGLALLLNCKTWWQVADSVLNSQRKRLHSAANNLNALKSEGFMKVQVCSVSPAAGGRTIECVRIQL